MEIDVMIRNRFLEFRISCIPPWLESISHMVEVTVLYSFLVWVKKPSIHDRDPEMVWMRLPRIERSEVLTRRPLIDKYCTRERNTVDRSHIDTKISHRLCKCSLAPLEKISLMWIRYDSLRIYLEVFLPIHISIDRESSRYLKFEYFPPMSSGTRWPLYPIISSVKEREGAPSRVEIFIILYEKSRNSEPSFWPFYYSHRSPEYDPMIHPERPNDLWCRLSVDLLSDDRVYIPEYLSRSDEFISFPDTMEDESRIALIILIKYPRTGTIVAVVFGNFWTVYGFH